MKKIGAEFILGVMLLPILAWVLTSIVSLQKADAVQEEKIETLLEITKETRNDVKFLLNKEK